MELKDTTLSKLITTGGEEVGCSTFLCRVVIALVVIGKEEKIVLKPASGKRRCNCRNEVYHKQIGPGMFQQMTEQVNSTSQNVDRKQFFLYSYFLRGLYCKHTDFMFHDI